MAYRQEVDTEDTLCGSRAVRRVNRGTRGNGVTFLFGKPVPNHAFEGTAASALRLLAVPSSLRSSAAPQRER